MNPYVDANLLDPFRPLFMQRAFAEILVLAIPAGLLGAWVVTRRLSFAAHALGHASFPVLVVAVIAGWSLFVPTLVAGVVIALLLLVAGRRAELANGVLVAVVLAAALATGAILASDVADPGLRANALLFGSLLSVGWDEVARSATVAVLALAGTLATGRGLAAGTFHRDLALADRRAVGASEAILMILLAATVAVAVVAVGSLLVSALLVVPSATARLITNRFVPLQVTGIALAAVEGIAGLWLAYELDAPPGAAIAVIASVVFALVAAGRALATRGRRVALIPS